MKKLLLQEELSNINDKKIELEDETSAKCKFMGNYLRMELVNVKEEDNNNYLNHKRLIEDVT